MGDIFLPWMYFIEALSYLTFLISRVGICFHSIFFYNVLGIAWGHARGVRSVAGGRDLIYCTSTRFLARLNCSQYKGCGKVLGRHMRRMHGDGAWSLRMSSGE